MSTRIAEIGVKTKKIWPKQGYSDLFARNLGLNHNYAINKGVRMKNLSPGTAGTKLQELRGY